MCVAFDLCMVYVFWSGAKALSRETHSKVAASSKIGSDYSGSKCAACACSAKVLIGFALSPSHTHFNQFDFGFVSLLLVVVIIIVRSELCELL